MNRDISSKNQDVSESRTASSVLESTVLEITYEFVSKLYGENYHSCLEKVEPVLEDSGYEKFMKCGPVGGEMRIVNVNNRARNPRIAKSHSARMWKKGDRLIYVCNCGLGIPMIAVNFPNTYQGDYYIDDGERKPYKPKEGDRICTHLDEWGFTPISPLGLIMMHMNKEL